MKTIFRAGYRYRFCDRLPLLVMLGLLVFFAFGCAGLQPSADPSQGIRLTAGQSSSGTFEQLDFAMPYRLIYEASGSLQVDADIIHRRRLSSLTVWLTAHDEAGRSLEKFILYHSGYRNRYKHHGGRQISQTLPLPSGTDFVAFSSISAKKESR